MLFRFLLYCFYLILKVGFGITAWKDENFKKRLKEKNFTMLIKTQDGKVARSFTLNNGKMSSKRGNFQNPDFAMIWTDASTAINVMKKGKPEELMAATADGRLQIEGDAGTMMWFMQTAIEMGNVYKKKKS